MQINNFGKLSYHLMNCIIILCYLFIFIQTWGNTVALIFLSIPALIVASTKLIPPSHKKIIPIEFGFLAIISIPIILNIQIKISNYYVSDLLSALMQYLIYGSILVFASYRIYSFIQLKNKIMHIRNICLFIFGFILFANIGFGLLKFECYTGSFMYGVDGQTRVAQLCQR